MQIALLIIYGLLLLFIFFYSLIQTNLVYNYLRFHKKKEDNSSEEIDVTKTNVPFVTIQLPIYNEKYVIERLIDAVSNFTYPKESFEIQVLDDSTDETVEIAATKIKEIREKGIQIHHVRRTQREGYKAGALAEGLKMAKGEFIAIFDADFIPSKDFLLKTTPNFEDENIGVVQTRWAHINKDYSLLTKLQAFGLDAHFSVEQTGRNAGGHFINFNGTAGIWRKKCIIDAGGWQSDTLTEDLDLSYRAQLKGWKFKYLENVGSPAELPATMNALKTQQFRWTKGAAECARKNLWSVLKSNNIAFSTKIHALFHLMNSFLFICIIMTSILSVPLLLIKNNFADYANLFKYGGFFLVSLLLLSVFYWVSYSKEGENKIKAACHFMIKFPMFLSISMGLSLHNAIAVAEGYIGKKTPFIRTPKFNITNNDDQWKGNKYLTSSLNLLTLLEGLLTFYFLTGIFLSFYFKDYGLLPFFFMLSMGFGLVFYYSIYHSHLSGLSFRQAGGQLKSIDNNIKPLNLSAVRMSVSADSTEASLKSVRQGIKH
ncbi:MAG: histidine kinase [Bacteroidetes bacterium]|nr:MAG: histidine kinase [Bacteroidota bacterium]